MFLRQIGSVHAAAALTTGGLAMKDNDDECGDPTLLPRMSRVMVGDGHKHIGEDKMSSIA